MADDKKPIKKIKGKHSAKKLPPFHLFQVQKHYFVFDTSTCRFYEIDKTAYCFLRLVLKYPLSKAKEIFCEKEKNEANISHSIKEFEKIGKNGLFDIPADYISEKDIANVDHWDPAGKIEDIQLMLAETCNLACKYCYCSHSHNNDTKNKKKLMPWKTAEAAVQLLTQQQTSSCAVTMFGGEPLLNKPVVNRLVQYVERIRSHHPSKQFRYVMTTNATLMDESMRKLITEKNFGLMVSIDGPQKTHDAQCPDKLGRGSFASASANIKELMKMRTVGVRSTMIHPMPNLKKLIDFFLDFGFNNMVIAPTTNRLDATGSCDFTPQDMRDFAKQNQKLLPWMLKYLEKDERPPYFFHERWYKIIKDGNINNCCVIPNCGAGWAVVGVDSQGFLYPCAKFCGLKKWKIGSVKNGLDVEKIKSIWQQFLRCIAPKCGKCWAYPLCHGPCLWECVLENGSFAYTNKFCFHLKKAIEGAAFLSSHIQEKNSQH